MPRVESPFSSQFFWEDRRRLCSQGPRSLKLDHFKIDHGLSFFSSPQSPQPFCCCCCCCFFFSLCTTLDVRVRGRIQKRICDLRSYGFFTTKTETEDPKKDHLPWTKACPLAPSDEKNRGKKQQTALILASVRIRTVLFLFERQSSLE